MPHARVKVTDISTTDQLGFDVLKVRARALAPDRAYTIFLLETAGAPFGAAEYLGDITTDRHGNARQQFKAIIDEAFSSTLANGQRQPRRAQPGRHVVRRSRRRRLLRRARRASMASRRSTATTRPACRRSTPPTRSPCPLPKPNTNPPAALESQLSSAAVTGRRGRRPRPAASAPRESSTPNVPVAQTATTSRKRALPRTPPRCSLRTAGSIRNSVSRRPVLD